MREILNLINHDVVNFRAVVCFEPDVVQYIVDRVHNIISTSPNFPSLILAITLINVELFFLCKETVRSQRYISLLGKILSRIEMRLSASFNCGVNLSPNQMGSDISGGVVFLLHIWPKVSNKVVIVNLKGHMIFILSDL